MKKVFIILLILLVGTLAYSGKEVTTPSVLDLNSNKVDLVSAKFVWGSTSAGNLCQITYKVQNNDRSQDYVTITYNVSGAAFTTLVSGFGATLESNLETNIWQDLQTRFGTVP